jgi:HK97 family phage major capsid protein
MKDKLEKLAADFKDANEQIGTILKAAEDDKRGLSEDESTRCDELETQCDELKTEIDRLDADAKRKQRQQARLDYLKQPRQRVTTPSVPGAGDIDAKRIDRSKLIYPIHRIGKLKGFRGPEAEEEAYRSGMWLRATIYGDERASAWCDEHGIERLTMVTDSNPDGGYLVPEGFERAVIQLREDYGVFRRESKILPLSDSDTTVIPRRTGGLTPYFVGEADAVTASDKSWDQVRVTARELAVLAKYSRNLSDDATISIADDLADEMARAFALKEDQCGFLGTGTSTYGGISGLITVCTLATAGSVEAAAGNTAFSTLDMTDFEAMVGKLPQYAEANAKWYISKPAYAASMMRLIDAAGGNTLALLEAGPGKREFLGYEVVIVQVMNSTLAAQTSTYGLCYFGDLRLATTLGDRRGIVLASSEHRYFEYRQVGLLASQRFGITCHDVGDTSNAGPLIMLKTPSS